MWTTSIVDKKEKTLSARGRKNRGEPTEEVSRKKKTQLARGRRMEVSQPSAENKVKTQPAKATRKRGEPTCLRRGSGGGGHNRLEEGKWRRDNLCTKKKDKTQATRGRRKEVNLPSGV